MGKLVVVVHSCSNDSCKSLKRVKKERNWQGCLNVDSVNAIELLKYLFLGFIRGWRSTIANLSSSGHLVLFEHFFGLKISGLSF